MEFSIKKNIDEDRLKRIEELRERKKKIKMRISEIDEELEHLWFYNCENQKEIWIKNEFYGGLSSY